MKSTITILVASLVLPSGCDHAKKAEQTEQTATAEASDSTCKEYAHALCKATAENSEVCRKNERWLQFLPAKACATGLKDLEYTKKKHNETVEACNALIEKVCKEFGPESEACKKLTRRMTEFPTRRCKNFLLKDYDKVVKELESLDDKDKPLINEQ